jgi:hypothetical protein
VEIVHNMSEREKREQENQMDMDMNNELEKTITLELRSHTQSLATLYKKKNRYEKAGNANNKRIPA